MEYNTSFFNTLGIGPKDSELEDFSRFFSSLKGKIDNIIYKECQLCKKNHKKFCNSHTIPKFILKNISENGFLYNQQKLNSTPLTKTENGLKNIQIFKSICQECDSKEFKDYENIKNYEHEPNQIILKQIALKDHLSKQYKLSKDINTYKYICEKYREIPNISNKKYKKLVAPIKSIIKPLMLDRIYSEQEIQEIYRHLKDDQNLYKIGYYKKLNYVIPIAMQSSFALYFDINGKKLINPFENKADGIPMLHFVIFPLVSESIILIFEEIDTILYDKFFMDLLKQNLSTQLSIINFIIFAYCEDVFINKNIDKNIFNNENLQQISQMQPISITESTNKINKKILRKSQISAYEKFYSLGQHINIPNLLDKKYSINKSIN